eukprot:CAMPEP_0170256966 /NCGR_PEP_ID=MMETSP0116_2-20130129/28338_1 /TAXON_ID=400756 /ORGANISM="Durinskia baltica, Strain CSIRO CS-38" /LENGTH=179 /DNA_ID=CAMNT_0010507979 /DNA_START=153 /DNA_END=694 /DNA_ORIENTATION=+
MGPLLSLRSVEVLQRAFVHKDPSLELEIASQAIQTGRDWWWAEVCEAGVESMEYERNRRNGPPPCMSNDGQAQRAPALATSTALEPYLMTLFSKTRHRDTKTTPKTSAAALPHTTRTTSTTGPVAKKTPAGCQMGLCALNGAHQAAGGSCRAVSNCHFLGLRSKAVESVQSQKDLLRET